MKTKNLSLVIFSIVLLSACKKSEELVPITTFTAPSTYSFADLSGKSTVDTKGQFVRIVLMQNLVAEIEKAKTQTVSEQTLLDIYTENNEDLSVYGSLTSGKNLQDKTLSSGKVDDIKQAGIDTLKRWFGQIADMSGASGTYVRNDGVDLKQAVEKFLMGALLYDQAVNKYLAITPDQSNTNFTSGQGSSMQHTFDEAFGYFGASRYFNNLSNTQIINYGADIDGVSGLDSLTEGCYYYATTAAKRESSNVSGTKYTDKIFNNFLTGRAAIVAGKYVERDVSIAQIELYWEEIIAATTVYYINDLLGDLDVDGNVVLPNADLSKHWTEMYYYFNMLIIDSKTKLSTAEKETIAALMGNDGGHASPVGVTKTDLESARDYFTKYFSSNELTKW